MHSPSPLVLCLALACAHSVFAQTAAFEVASVKPAQDPGRVPIVCLTPCAPGERMTVEGARVDIRFMSLQKLILTAYHLKAYQLSGPDWMEHQRFEILARMPEGANRDQIPAMLQSLLAERFGLSLHRENREQSVLALVIGKKGLKLKDAAADAAAPAAAPGDRALYTPEGDAHIDSSGGAVVTAGLYGPLRMSGRRIDLLRITMPQFAELLMAHEDHPVIDMSGLKGSYEIHVTFDPPEPSPGGRNRKDGSPPPPGADPMVDFVGEGFRRTVEELGLKLEPRKAPIETMVVDRLEKTPTRN